jgi:trehalose 6-phosphate phosphatase
LAAYGTGAAHKRYLAFCAGYWGGIVMDLSTGTREIALESVSDGVDLGAFFERVRHADHRALLLDYDGTLAPFTVQRDRAVPYPEVQTRLTEILSLGNTRLVIVSGRAVADLTGLIGLDPLPEIWGSHGWEHLSGDGKYSLTRLDDQSKQKLDAAARFLSDFVLPNLCEVKPISVAAHWRGLPSREAEVIKNKVSQAWSKIVGDSQLEIRPFDGGLELRPKGKDKGSAVSEILSSMRGTVAAAYLGDDLTDEDAFKAMKGRGLGVLVREEARPTLADIWLRPPEELIEFLTQWRNACDADRRAL